MEKEGGGCQEQDIGAHWNVPFVDTFQLVFHDALYQLHLYNYSIIMEHENPDGNVGELMVHKLETNDKYYWKSKNKGFLEVYFWIKAASGFCSQVQK